MLYITRSHYKESLSATDLGEANKYIDTEVLPAAAAVQGVRSAASYNSISGEMVFFLDVENLATIDRVLADPGCRKAFAEIYSYFSRSGGEVLYERPTWQGLYGGS